MIWSVLIVVVQKTLKMLRLQSAKGLTQLRIRFKWHIQQEGEWLALYARTKVLCFIFGLLSKSV